MLLHAIIVDVYPILLLQAWKHGCGERGERRKRDDEQKVHYELVLDAPVVMIEFTIE
jgi:hypothetical protein